MGALRRFWLFWFGCDGCHERHGVHYIPYFGIHLCDSCLPESYAVCRSPKDCQGFSDWLAGPCPPSARERWFWFWLAIAVAAVCLFAEKARADDVPPDHLGETAISSAWCEARGGIAEARLADGARVDCLLPDLAVEHDWAKAAKPYECLGQAAYYARETGRAAMCVLIRRNGQPAKDFIRYARRAMVAGHGDVLVECITEDGAAFDCALAAD